MTVTMRPRDWLLLLAGALLVTDLAVALDIPVLRQVLAFLYFTTVPGFLVLCVLKLQETRLVRKSLLSLGLSIAFLLLGGLLVNSLIPVFGYQRPLSSPSLLVSFNIILLALFLAAYLRNRRDFDSPRILGLRMGRGNWLVSPLLLSMLLPLLAILGTRLMNATGSNIVLLVTFSLIPAYVVLLILLRGRVPTATYPTAVLMMSLALLLSRGLTSNYLMGGDVYTEYFSSQVTSQNLHWSMSNFPAMVGGSLSVSLLPTVFQSLLGIDAIHVYKSVFPMLLAFIPVVAYAICVRYLTPLHAFLASCFMMAQIPFMYLLTGQMRVGISLFFLTLAIMVLFDGDTQTMRKSPLLVIFGVSTMVAYYVTPILLAVLMAVLWLAPKIPRSPIKSRGLVRASSMLLIVMFFSLWWGVFVRTLAPGEALDLPGKTAVPIQTPAPGETPAPGQTPAPGKETAPASSGYAAFLEDVFADVSPSDLSDPELRGPEVRALLQLPSSSPPKQATVVINYLAFLAIGLGVVALWLAKSYRKSIDPSYSLLISASLVLAALPIILPRLSTTYAGDRLYLQLVFILAPAFVIGSLAVSKYILPRRNLLLVGLLLVGLFVCNSYLLHQFLGSPQGDVLDTKSASRALTYVYDSEVRAAEWLGDSNLDNAPVRVGSTTQLGSGVFEFTRYGVTREFNVWSFGLDGLADDGESWVFLRHINVVDGVGYRLDANNYIERFSMEEYPDIVDNRNKVYTTGDTEIYW